MDFDKRSASVVRPDVPAQGRSDGVFDGAVVAALHRAQPFDRMGSTVHQLRNQALDFVLGHDSLAGNTRRSEGPATPVQHNRRSNNALLGKAPARPDMLRIERHKATAVESKAPDPNLAETLHTSPGNPQQDTVFYLGDGSDAAVARQSGVGTKMVQLAMYRNRRLRPYPLIHPPELVAPRMPGHMHEGVLRSHNFHTHAKEPVLQPGNGPLVARYRA